MSNTKLTTPQAGTPSSSSSSSSSSSPSAAAVAAAAGAGTKSGKSNVEIIIEGYLYKKSPKNILGKHPWQKRYFILALITTEKGSHKSLIYYQSHEAVKSQAQALGAIPMDNIKAIVVSDNKNGRFNIKIAGREYALRCDTVAELQRWVNGLSLFMEKSTKYEKPKELPDSPSDTMRLMATTPNAHALFSADDTIAMMQRGSAFIKYNRVSKTSNEVDRQVVLVFYKKDQTPLGSLYWCEPGVAHSLPSRGLPLHTLTDVYLGKQTAAFKSPLAAGSHSEKCFSVVGADGNEYNLEGDTRELIAAWLFGINSLMTRTGGKKVITVESTRSGKTRTVGPKPTKSSSSHHSKSSTPATATAAPAGTAATTTTTTPTAAEPAPAKVATPEATPVSATASASASASASSPLEASQTDAQAQQEAAAQKARDEATLRAQQVAEEQMRAAAGPMAALRALQQKRASEGTEQSKDTAEQAAHHHHHATEQATQALASTTISDKEEPAAAETAEGYASPTDHSLAAHHVNHAESLSRDAVHQQAAAEAEAHAQAQAEAEAEARRRALSEQHRYEEQLYESAQRAQRERERIELERQREYEDMLREEQAAEDAAAATAAAAAAAAAASASSPSNQYQQDDTPPSHSPIASPSHAADIVATPYSDPEQATVIPVARPLTQAEIEALSPIGQWLYHVGPIYLEYQSAFESSGIDHEFLVTLTDDDLQDLGVSKGLHRKKLLVAIEKEKQIQEAEKKRREEEEQAAQAAQRAQGKAVTPSATTATASRTTASSVSGMNPHDLIKQNIRLAKERNAQKKLQFAEPTATSPEEDGTMTIAAMAAKLAAARLAREGSGAVTPRETPRDTVPSSQHIYPTPTSSSSSSSTSTSSKPLPANVVLLDQIRPMDASQLTWMNLPKFPSKATTQQETDTKAAQDEFFQTRAEAAERRKSQAHGVLPPASSSSSSSSSSNDTAHTQSIEQTLRRTTVIDASGALTDSAAVATVPVVTASIDDDDDAGVVDDSTNDAGIDDGVDTIDPALAQAIGSVAQGSEHTTAHGVALAPHHISHRVSIHAAPPSSLPSSGYATPREQ